MEKLSAEERTQVHPSGGNCFSGENFFTETNNRSYLQLSDAKRVRPYAIGIFLAAEELFQGNFR